MCGIVAIVSKENIVPLLIDGLKRLEYRGYDSAGLAVTTQENIRCIRAVGRVATMEKRVIEAQLSSPTGIAHTRWASHGGVTEPNAHPHVSCDEIAVVHNGIIENYETKRNELRAQGYTFLSETDSEVIAHLIHCHYQTTQSLLLATKLATEELSGAYSVAVMSLKNPGRIVASHRGCPLILGLDEEKNSYYIASDVSAIVTHTRRVIILKENDTVEITPHGFCIFDASSQPVARAIHVSNISPALLELGNYAHFMQKEIHEQPSTLASTIKEVLLKGFCTSLFGPEAHLLQTIDSVLILACGTSYFAGLIAREWIESLARIPCVVEIASEYRYRDSIANPKQLVITISQSGETRDTHQALKQAILLGHEQTLSICNAPESAIPLESKFLFYTQAGKEIGVASTKAFTAQLAALFTFAATLAKVKKRLTQEKEVEYLEALKNLPGSVQHALNIEPQIALWAEIFAHKNHALFLGRGAHYPIALEGALKLKEITYIHSEAYQAGELKHGPIALIDNTMPIVVVAPNDTLLDKLKSNMQEVRARGGELFVCADLDSHFVDSEGVHIARLPCHAGILSPIIHAIPMQLLAYHTGLQRGTDVDKPRNLAKSLTVE